jgi:hypothetical protein
MGRCAAAGNPPASSLRGLLLDADLMLLKILPKLSEAAASRKQGPRVAGMRPSAITVSRRYDAFVRFAVIIGGDGMSSEYLLGYRSQGVSYGY